MTVDRTHRPPAHLPPRRPDRPSPGARSASTRSSAGPGSGTWPTRRADVRRRTQRLVLTRRGLVLAALVLVAVLGVTVGAGYLISRDLTDNVKRLPGRVRRRSTPRPGRLTGKSLTFLLVGTDSPLRRADHRLRRRRRRRPRIAAQRRADDRAAEPGPDRGRRRVDPPGQLGRHPRPRAGQDQRGVRARRPTAAHRDRREPHRHPRSTTSPSSTSPASASMVDAVGGIDVGIDTPTHRRRRRLPRRGQPPRRPRGAGLRPAAVRAGRWRPRPGAAAAERPAGARHPGRRAGHAVQPGRHATSCSTPRAGRSASTTR